MSIDIHSTVFTPIEPGDPYLVVASILSLQAITAKEWKIQEQHIARTLEEATAKCCELACALRRMIQERGRRVSGIRCSHCPTPATPSCGRLAIPRPAK